MQEDPFSFLIIGAGRGGTSLLAGLLDSHPRLEVGFELGAVRHLMGRAIAHRWRGPTWRFDRGLIAHRAERFLATCRAEAARHPEKRWGNKITTEQLAGLEDHNLANPAARVDVVDYFFGRALAGTKVVFILRDGRACVRSKMNRAGLDVAEACRRWRFSVDVWRYLSERHERNVRVRFEDLLADPRAVLGHICAFLDVPFDPAMLAGTRSAKIPAEYRRGGVDASAATVGDVPPGCLELIEESLRECGYLSNE